MKSGWPGLVAVGVGFVAVAVGALLLGRDSASDRNRIDASGPVRIREKGARQKPTVELEPELAERVESDAPLDFLPDPRSLDSIVADDPIAYAQVAVRRARHRDALAQVQARSRQPATSDPNDIEVTGMVTRPPPVESPAAAPTVIVPIDPPDPLKAPPPNHGASTKPPPTDPLLVESGLPKDVIRRVVRRAMEPIRACYDDELATHPGLEGTLQVTFTIGVEGVVTSAAATGMDGAVGECVAGVIRGLQFPRPDGGGTVSVRYPFPFRPTS